MSLMLLINFMFCRGAIDVTTVNDRTVNVDEERRDNTSADDVIIISDSDESVELVPACKDTELVVLASASKDDEISSSDSDSEFADEVKQGPSHCLVSANKDDESVMLAPTSKDDELSSSNSDSEFADLVKHCPLCCFE